MGYKFIKLLGKGSYGSVYLAKNKSSQSANDYVAIKKFSIRDKTSYTSFKNELKIFKKIESEYLVKILDYYKDSDYIYLVMEYAPHGDLEEYIRSFYSKRKKIDTKFVDTIIYQVSEGLKVLHKNNIIHRDIKTANILVFNKNLIKITDFGISKILENNLLAKSNIGTPYYMSPEIIRGIPYDFSVDFWAFGCLIYKVLTNYYPFEASDMASLMYKIKSGKYNLSIIPDKYKMIVSKLINKNINRGSKKDINNFIISNCNTFVRINDINLCDSLHVKSINHTSVDNKLLPPLKHENVIDSVSISANLKSKQLEPIKNKINENKELVKELVQELEQQSKHTNAYDIYRNKQLEPIKNKINENKELVQEQELEQQLKHTKAYDICRNYQLEQIKDNINKKLEYKSNINEPAIINHNIREYKKYEYKSRINEPVIINHNIQSNYYESNKNNYEYYRNRNRNSNYLFNNKLQKYNLKPIKKNLNYKESDEEPIKEDKYNNFIKHNIKNVKKIGDKRYKCFLNMQNNIKKLPEIKFRPPFRF
jgi:serine/threonine protein kinase|uniref:Protein kinase domain-containing protein n=1 Tax=viral metagenome TaxID=1070528 RepID=A0A6C0ITI3_9ZZZZ